MPKYNLMDSQLPDFLDEKFEVDKSKSDKSEKEIKISETKEIKLKPTPPESDFSEKLFNETEIPRKQEDRPPSTLHPDTETPAVSTPVKPALSEDTITTRGFVKSETDSSSYRPRDLSMYEETLQSPNYKPLIIGLSIFAAVAVILLLVWKLFLAGKHEAVPPPETAEQKLKREMLLRKNNILNTVNATTNSQLGPLVQLINSKPAKVHCTGLYVFDQSLACEVFTTNRTDLAEFNLLLNRSSSFSNFNLQTVDMRPGSRGGLFALYDIKTTGNTATNPVGLDTVHISSTPQDWITTAQRNGLSVEMQRQVSSRQEELFNIVRYEYKLKGPDTNCQSLIAGLLTAKNNIGIHKLTLLPTNQRDLAKSPYQLHLILDFYM